MKRTLTQTQRTKRTTKINERAKSRVELLAYMARHEASVKAK